MQQSVNTHRCVHNVLDNGVHEFVFSDASRAAFDEFLANLEQVAEARQPDERVCLLLDWRQSGIPPLQYAFQRVREYLQKHPSEGDGRTAIVYDYGALVSLMQSFVRLLDSDSRTRLFPADQHAAAIAWLLEK